MSTDTGDTGYRVHVRQTQHACVQGLRLLYIWVLWRGAPCGSSTTSTRPRAPCGGYASGPLPPTRNLSCTDHFAPPDYHTQHLGNRPTCVHKRTCALLRSHSQVTCMPGQPNLSGWLITLITQAGYTKYLSLPSGAISPLLFFVFPEPHVSNHTRSHDWPLRVWWEEQESPVAQMVQGTRVAQTPDSVSCQFFPGDS